VRFAPVSAGLYIENIPEYPFESKLPDDPFRMGTRRIGQYGTGAREFFKETAQFRIGGERICLVFGMNLCHIIINVGEALFGHYPFYCCAVLVVSFFSFHRGFLNTDPKVLGKVLPHTANYLFLKAVTGRIQGTVQIKKNMSNHAESIAQTT